MKTSQETLKRTLIVIDLLAKGRTLEQLAQTTNVSTRTIRRYIETLNEIGKKVERDATGRWKTASKSA